jgi:hypothetical protein
VPEIMDTVPLREHLALIRELEDKLNQERDRRYAEVNIEREKALKIKEEADRTALTLARENQNLKDENQKQVQLYRDEKANELREQINKERNLYASKEDLANLLAAVDTKFEPLNNFVNNQTGGDAKTARIMAMAIGVAVIIGAVISVIGFILVQ